ncbi:MAG: hypothetical protein DLM67_15720 [Candidatus Nephthysia bennettiae]|uniref:TlpA family protein disulfide reductase n=1 Tax=Candidatus Nephthysia bennettiae TaxID=3127016 RepID=A0A934K7A6_9BACT|nr:TlpA family protein disulfide reductase [Candidatus Dormibacteraeota bacterium]MBJ7611373.1 TlpA family protein disulfide reductase [Candidatus Dormibacteraeota bacterium]PZR91843.1 MAG: hypothetical protein DLM67_15720 [Candidatus Dormibacteraeota bacterium]
MPRADVRFIGTLLAAALLTAACGGGASVGGRAAASTARPIPAGFTRYDGAQLGVELALAPGWNVAGTDPQSGISFNGPNGLVMLVHVEQAVSPDLDANTAVLLGELTHGSGVSKSLRAAAKLAERPAEKISGRFPAAGMTEGIEAYVMVESHRAWAVVLAGAPDQVDAARSDFDRMVGTFRLVGARPSPPARATVGLPAPTFPELDRIKGPVVINFFATWCPDCRTEMPLMARRAASSHGRFTLLGVDCCSDSPSGVPGFLEGMGIRNDFRHLAYDNDGHLGRAYGLLGPPTTAFLDGDHVLRQVVIGSLTAATLEQGLKAAEAA